jgi:hypothetical protein
MMSHSPQLHALAHRLGEAVQVRMCRKRLDRVRTHGASSTPANELSVELVPNLLWNAMLRFPVYSRSCQLRSISRVHLKRRAAIFCCEKHENIMKVRASSSDRVSVSSVSLGAPSLPQGVTACASVTSVERCVARPAMSPTFTQKAHPGLTRNPSCYVPDEWCGCALRRLAVSHSTHPSN